MRAAPSRQSLPAPEPVSTAGCPIASQVFVASYLTRNDAGSSGPAGHWVLPLYDRKVDSLSDQPEFASLDARDAEAVGVPAAPPVVWLLNPGQQPCKAIIAGYYSAAVDAPEPNVTYGAQLDGCPAPPADQQDDAEAIAVAADQSPIECQMLAPQPIASRLGETDAEKHWQRPTKQTPIPPGLVAAIPPHDCRAPGCEMLWTIAQVAVADRPVAWAGAINWLMIPPNAAPATQCEWKAETFAGFFVVGRDGKAIKITEGQQHPLLMSAVLADRNGARVLIAEGAGEYATYDLSAGKVTLGRDLAWLHLAPDVYAVDERIGPSCGQDSDAPAAPAP